MKRIVSFLILLSILLNPIISFADYEIVDNSFEYVNPKSDTLQGTTVPLIYQITNQIEVREVDRAIRLLQKNIRIPFSFDVHIMDYSLWYTMTLGVAFDNETILLFDFLPFKSRILVHDVVAHEIGHLVYFRMTDWDKAVYRILRDIPEDWTEESEYARQPSEIFAEDFRLLFGSKYAKTLGHNNQELGDVEDIEGLRELVLNIVIR